MVSVDPAMEIADLRAQIIAHRAVLVALLAAAPGSARNPVRQQLRSDARARLVMEVAAVAVRTGLRSEAFLRFLLRARLEADTIFDAAATRVPDAARG